METYKAIWIGEYLPLWEQISLMSFVKNKQKIELFTYGNVNFIPEGVTVRNGEDILPKDEVFVNTMEGPGSYSGFADRFRYAMLLKEGGCYVDTDVIMLKPVDLPDFAFSREDDLYINNAVLKIPLGHTVLQEMLDHCRHIGERFKWGETGPMLLTKTLIANNLADKALPKNFAYAIPPGNARDFINPNLSEIIEAQLSESSFVHWWHEVFRRNNVNVNVMPPEGSWLHNQFLKILES